MRFMIIVPAGPETEQGQTGTQQQFADMQAYNEQMLKAGVFVDGQGLHPSAKGARVTWERRRLGRHRRALRRGQGAHRRLHDHRRQLPRGGHRVAQEVAGLVRARARPRPRAAPGPRARGLRRRVHPRAARARGADASRGRPQRGPRLTDPHIRPTPPTCVREWRGVTDHRPAHRRRRTHARGGLAHGGRQGDGRRRPPRRRRRPRRGPRAGRVRAGPRAVAPRRHTQQAGRVAHVHGATAGHRPHPSRRQPREQAAAGRTSGGAEGGRAGRGRLRRGPRGHRRRRPRPDLRRVPSGSHRPGADLLDPEDDRRSDDPRDRPRVPHHRVDRGAADLAGEADPEPGRHHRRDPIRRRAAPAARLGARGRLPHLQRGVCRHVGSRLGAR